MNEEKAACELDPLTLLRLGYLKIKDKGGRLISLELNEVQKKVLAIIRDRRIKKKPVRLCILKGRQFGISTLIESIIYCYTSQKPNLNALIIADDEDGSDYLFDMTKLYHEELERNEPHLSPKRKVSNEKKLEFEATRSKILIDTSRNPSAGRKYTFQLAHLSEVSRFADLNTTLDALLQSVPDLPETFVVLETTANGENEFCEFWNKIEQENTRGEYEWQALFLSWKDHAEYSRAFETESEKNQFIRSMTEDEKKIMELHELTLEQMNWRRKTIKDKCRGNLRIFQQEYPLTPKEAFITSGKRVFPHEWTDPQEKHLSEPKYRGEIEEVNRLPTLISRTDGLLKIFKPPQTGHVYVIGADTSEGLPGGDYSAAQVIDRSTWEQVAVFHGLLPPEVYGERLFWLGAYYRWCLLAVESNRGIVPILKLRDMGYPNLSHHMRLHIDESGVTETEELGFNTTVKTKPTLISDLGEALRGNLLVLHDRDTKSELDHYSELKRKESGHPVYGGAGAYHDDRVMALAIAVHHAKQLPEFFNTSRTSPEVHSTSRTGY